MTQIKPKSKADTSGMFGLFSKREAANLIAAGARHIHSSALGGRDALARATQEALRTRTIPLYSWETLQEAQRIIISQSKERFDTINEICRSPQISGRRHLREKVHSVLEELTSNAIFHSYQTKSGPKYRRKDSITLADNEKIEILFAANDHGVFLSVKDQGGTHGFDDIARSLQRCFQKTGLEIENKESGAGLGLYMIFDSVTHWKISCRPKQETIVTCWIADKKHFDPDTYSFNYFEGG